ncbi:MAG: tetratricopeptide repeat protein [Treponema sp.]|jgi:Ca-activated chloride channel family protein|nr:tetratricopeptide repeat protein [Treponema sp.]
MRNRVGLCILLLLLCGCSRIGGQLLVMDANFQASRGMYTNAVSSYMKALEYPEAAPYSEFGLGSVYFAIGEEKAALERFGEAATLLEAYGPSASRELRYRILYNTGVVLFSEGDFSGAVDSFRNALKIDGGKKDAKRNLELSIRSLERENSDGGGNEAEENESMAAMFEYVRQKEFNQWKSMEWQKEEDTNEPDY